MADDQVVVPVAALVSETFSREYVAELRSENKTYRLKAQEQADAAKAAQEAATKATSEADAKVSTAMQAANERILRAELKASALKAGMVDLDGLKLADLSAVKLNDAGEVEGADALMAAMKESKPYLFGSASTTTQTREKPDPKTPETKKATEMTTDEYAAHKKATLSKK